MPNLTIEQARSKIARIVAQYGEKYLPIFIRLDKEYQKQLHMQEQLDKALMIATQIATQNATQNLIAEKG